MRYELEPEKILAIVSGVEQLPGLSCVVAEMAATYPRLSISLLDLSGSIEFTVCPRDFKLGRCAIELLILRTKKVLPTWTRFIPIVYRESLIRKKAQVFKHLAFGHLASPSMRLEKVAPSFKGQLWSFGDAGILFGYEFLHAKLTKIMLRHPRRFLTSMRLMFRSKSVSGCDPLKINLVGVKTVNKTNHRVAELIIGAPEFREALLGLTGALGLCNEDEAKKLWGAKYFLLYPNFSSSNLLSSAQEQGLVLTQMLAIGVKKEDQIVVKFHPSMKPRFIKTALGSLSAAGYTHLVQANSRAPAEAIIGEGNFTGKVITFSINDRFLTQVSGNVVRAPTDSDAITLWHKENGSHD